MELNVIIKKLTVLFAVSIILSTSAILGSCSEISNFYTSHLTEASETNSTVPRHLSLVTKEFTKIELANNDESIQIERSKNPLEELTKTSLIDNFNYYPIQQIGPTTDNFKEVLPNLVVGKKPNLKESFINEVLPGTQSILLQKRSEKVNGEFTGKNNVGENTRTSIQNTGVVYYAHFFIPIFDNVMKFYDSLLKNINEFAIYSGCEFSNSFVYVQNESKKNEEKQSTGATISSKTESFSNTSPIPTTVSQNRQIQQNAGARLSHSNNSSERINSTSMRNSVPKINVISTVVPPQPIEGKTKVENARASSALHLILIIAATYLITFFNIRKTKKHMVGTNANLNRSMRIQQYNRGSRKRYIAMNKCAAVILCISLASMETSALDYVRQNIYGKNSFKQQIEENINNKIYLLISLYNACLFENNEI